MSELSKTEQYIALRLEGAGHREAWRAAGFASGTSSAAVRMYRYAIKVRKDPRALRWIQARLEAKEREVEQLREHLRVAQLVERLDVGGDSISVTT